MNKTEIMKLFHKSTFKALDTILIDKLLEKSIIIGEGATSTVYGVINCLTKKGFLCFYIGDETHNPAILYESSGSHHRIRRF